MITERDEEIKKLKEMLEMEMGEKDQTLSSKNMEVKDYLAQIANLNKTLKETQHILGF